MNNENQIENKNNKVRMNIFLFSLLMLVVFVATFYLIHIYFSSAIYMNIISNIFTEEIIFEAILALLAFIILLFWNNSYVFTQKREKFISTLKYGCFHLIMSFFFLISSINVFMDNLPGVFNIALYTLLIGLYEEFLLRGWLLNEFLERYGNTKKGVWISIITSGVIFGLVHFINISTSGFASTFTQVFNAISIGITLGFIYYKTKNIWTVVFLHAFWDFTLFLGYLAPITEVSSNLSNLSPVSIIASILLALSQLIILIPFIKNIDEEVKKSKLVKYSILAVIAYFVLLSLIGISSNDFENEIYKIDNISIKEYTILEDNYESYDLIEENIIVDEDGNDTRNTFSFSLSKENNSLVLKNNSTNDMILFDCETLIDYSLYEFENYYILSYVEVDNSGNNILKYNYLYKSDINNDKDYMNNIKDSMKSYLISDYGNLCIIHDKKTQNDYLSVKTRNYGYFVLLDDTHVAILNRD
ncbi:MAG: type II CAAX prenyl endopeptidase Rce1 family protein [Bacilli bacterium]